MAIRRRGPGLRRRGPGLRRRGPGCRGSGPVRSGPPVGSFPRRCPKKGARASGRGRGFFSRGKPRRTGAPQCGTVRTPTLSGRLAPRAPTGRSCTYPRRLAGAPEHARTALPRTRSNSHRTRRPTSPPVVPVVRCPARAQKTLPACPLDRVQRPPTRDPGGRRGPETALRPAVRPLVVPHRGAFFRA